ncbi:glycosyltransferase family 2 protein [Clostridium neonatale]|uniref:glycosyltransferase family 2 protein n=1 Tax=Clostridium neonatale TaxID=137838 RepID=UPI0029374359|nr:glycosyltransferase family 2 protein [Clostridium neonatale]
MKVLIIIPAYNEQENIESVVKNLKDNYSHFDYIVINDCSTDNTKKILDKNNYNYIDLPVNLGIGGGIQTGYKFALKNNYDIAIQMDGDGQHDPKYFDEIIEYMQKENADIVIGSRFIKKDGFQSTIMRRLGIQFLSKLIKVVSGANIKDVTSGYRIVNKRFIELYAKEYAQDYPEPEAIISAAINNGKIIEYPVIMKERIGGTSSISSIKSIYYMIKVSLAIILCRITIDKKRR